MALHQRLEYPKTLKIIKHFTGKVLNKNLHWLLKIEKLDGGSDLAEIKLSAEPDSADSTPPTGSPAGHRGFALPVLGNIGNIGLHHTILNPAANLGY